MSNDRPDLNPGGYRVADHQNDPGPGKRAGTALATGAAVVIWSVSMLALAAGVVWALWWVGGGWMGTPEQQDLEAACVAQADAAGLPAGERWLDFVDDCVARG